jgi:hypothetical protein
MYRPGSGNLFLPDHVLQHSPQKSHGKKIFLQAKWEDGFLDLTAQIYDKNVKTF